VTINFDFYKLKLVQDTVQLIADARTKLLEELVIHASDPTIKMRRFRMLKQLSQFESQIIEKIWRFETVDHQDLLQINFLEEIQSVVSRDA
jgi:hypothetical protein